MPPHAIFLMFFHEFVEEPNACKLFATEAVIMHELLLLRWLRVESVLPSLVACQ